MSRITDLIDLVLPRFVHEGKKYATIAIGCTGGRHRSVYLVERLAAHLASRRSAVLAAGESGLAQGKDGWRRTVTHRELSTRDLDLEGQAKGSRSGETPTDGRSSGARDALPGTAHEVQGDGDGQKTAPIQAQEA
jgi:UPF0042 nucleotide-binding protein